MLWQCNRQISYLFALDGHDGRCAGCKRTSTPACCIFSVGSVFYIYLFLKSFNFKNICELISKNFGSCRWRCGLSPRWFQRWSTAKIHDVSICSHSGEEPKLIQSINGPISSWSWSGSSALGWVSSSSGPTRVGCWSCRDCGRLLGEMATPPVVGRKGSSR